MSHPSALRLDALALGGLSDGERRELEAHLAACARCRLEASTSAASRTEFERGAYGDALRSVRKRLQPARSWWRRLVPTSAALVVAAATVLVVLKMPHATVEPAYGIKGGPSLHLYGRRDGKVFPVQPGAKLRAGDQLRFAVANQPAGYLMIASVDGAGRGSIYFPFDGQRSARVESPNAELPGSVILDEVAGPERLFALWSDEPLAATKVLSSLRELGAQGDHAVRAATALPVAARDQKTLLIEKGPP